MGSANTHDELVRIVLDGLLEAVPAEAGAILMAKEGKEFEVSAHRHRDPSVHRYTPVSDFIVFCLAEKRSWRKTRTAIVTCAIASR